MRVMIFFEIVLTLIEIIYCGFFRTFFCIIGRVLFMLRFLGIQINIKILLALEGTGFLVGVLFPPLFKFRFSLKVALVYLGIGIVLSLMELYEANASIYFEGDVTEEHYKLIHIFRLKKGRVKIIREKLDYLIYFIDSQEEVKFESKVNSKNLTDEELCVQIYKAMEKIYPVISHRRRYIIDTLMLKV